MGHRVVPACVPPKASGGHRRVSVLNHQGWRGGWRDWVPQGTAWVTQGDPGGMPTLQALAWQGDKVSCPQGGEQ